MSHKMDQKEFTELLKEYDRQSGFAKCLQLLKDIFAARCKEDKILIWKNQLLKKDTVEMAIVQFFDDKKVVKRAGITSVDDACYRMVRYSFTEHSINPGREVYAAQFVSPEAMVSDFEEVNIYNLIDVTNEPAAQEFAAISKYPGFDWLWAKVNEPRDFTIIHREELVAHFHIEHVTTVEEAIAEYQARSSNGEYDYGDMEMVDSSDEAVPENE